MSLGTAIREIEGSGFSARVSVASDVETFIEALRSEPAVMELLDLIKDDAARNCLLLRLQALVYERSDVRYRNPRDVAIAAYTWSLSIVDLGLGSIAALSIQASATRCWWAAKVARLVLQGAVVPSQTETVVTAANTIASFSPIATFTATGDEQEDLMVVLETGFNPLGTAHLISPSAVVVRGPGEQIHQQWMPASRTWTMNNTGIPA